MFQKKWKTVPSVVKPSPDGRLTARSSNQPSSDYSISGHQACSLIQGQPLHLLAQRCQRGPSWENRSPGLQCLKQTGPDMESRRALRRDELTVATTEKKIKWVGYKIDQMDTGNIECCNHEAAESKWDHPSYT